MCSVSPLLRESVCLSGCVSAFYHPTGLLLCHLHTSTSDFCSDGWSFDATTMDISGAMLFFKGRRRWGSGIWDFRLGPLHRGYIYL